MSLKHRMIIKYQHARNINYLLYPRQRHSNHMLIWQISKCFSGLNISNERIKMTRTKRGNETCLLYGSSLPCIDSLKQSENCGFNLCYSDSSFEFNARIYYLLTLLIYHLIFFKAHILSSFF
jgi:hypothetical protein